MDEGSVTGVSRRVLIVDADPAFSRTLHEEFRTHGFEVLIAESAAQARSLFTQRGPDLVVLDLYLPEGAARNLLRDWKAEVPGAVVILVSGHASFNMVIDALKEGARRFFTKPVGAATLLQALEDRQEGKVADRPFSSPFLSPLVSPSLGSSAAIHQLGTAALTAEGIDNFFAISPGLMCIAGFDGYFKMLNPAWEKTLGYSVDELCSSPYLGLVHPDDRDKASDEALEIRGGHTVFRFKNRYRCKDGSYRWLAWSATPAPAQRLIYASARDVTNSVRMEEGLRGSNERLKQTVARGEVRLLESTIQNEGLLELGRFKDEVAAMIVHDLKGPLAVIISNYDYIAAACEGLPADCQDALDDSQLAGRRMLRLLANLIDVNRGEQGTLELSRRDASVVPIFEAVAHQRRVLARSRDITMGVVPGPECVVSIDSDLMTRVVENIFDNALRYAPNGGTIQLEQRRVGPDVEFRIGNSGIAVPMEARSSIFEKFRQVEGGAGRMNLGLGLYFCRVAIEAHGGAIWVEETVRLPAVFAIRLPAARPA